MRTSNKILPLASVLMICAGTLGLLAQDRTTVSDPGIGANLPLQKIGADDLLQMRVYDSPEFTHSLRVSPDGTIRIPMVKEPIPVQGMLPSQVESLVAELLQKEKLLIDPFVTITVAEYHSRPISVAGAVKTPTTFQAIGTVTLLEALTRAGGILDGAGSELIVTRQNGAGGSQWVQRIPVKQLIEGSDPELNLKLSGGEEIRVPESGKIVVTGSVARPGVFPMLDSLSKNTVSTVIAQAGGLAPFADHVAYILRVDDQGVTHTIPVPLWDIINRRQPDMSLQAKDILQVPDSPRRRMTQTAIQTVTGVGAAATTGLVIRR